MTTIHIAIVGIGPRGLNVFQNITAKAADTPECVFDVHLVDPGEPGQGAHPADQTNCLIANTMAGQVSVSLPIDMANVEAGSNGPSLTEWARAVGYKRVPDGYAIATEGEAVNDDDYLPRAMLGSYLRYTYEMTITNLPKTVQFTHHRTIAIDIYPSFDGWAIKLENGREIESDFVFLTTGHNINRLNDQETAYRDFAARHQDGNPKIGFFKTIYPVKTLDRIVPGSTVAIQGLGLTASDAIAALTIGRGGKFDRRDGPLAYRRSGREPRILVFSRNGLPYTARGVNQKGIAGRHVPRFFSPECIELLRKEAMWRRGTPQLDFEAEVLPVLKKEMAYAFRTAREGREPDRENFFPTPEETRVIDLVLDPVSGRKFANFAKFREFALDFFRSDLDEAYKGNLTSPIKAATDAIRDCRDALLAAVEFRGLLPESHRNFIDRYAPTINRMSFGPPRHRNSELLALIEAGVVDWGGGPFSQIELDEKGPHFTIRCSFEKEETCRKADVLIIARLDAYRPADDIQPLSANLLKRGLIRPFNNGPYHPCGIDIDSDHHPIGCNGLPLKTLRVIGYPTEGARFYTHALPRPFRRSGPLVDGGRAVAEMFNHIRFSNIEMSS